jgi:hypothetical protein
MDVAPAIARHLNLADADLVFRERTGSGVFSYPALSAYDLERLAMSAASAGDMRARCGTRSAVAVDLRVIGTTLEARGPAPHGTQRTSFVLCMRSVTGQPPDERVAGVVTVEKARRRIEFFAGSTHGSSVSSESQFTSFVVMGR